MFKKIIKKLEYHITFPCYSIILLIADINGCCNKKGGSAIVRKAQNIMNIKKMNQDEYDKYLVCTLIPEMKEEYGNVTTVILKGKKIHFAKTCEICGDLILVDKDFELCSSAKNADKDSLMTYLGILTELEVVDFDEISECECFEDVVIDNDEVLDETEDDYYDDLGMKEEDGYDDDYGDGNYEK